MGKKMSKTLPVFESSEANKKGNPTAHIGSGMLFMPGNTLVMRPSEYENPLCPQQRL